MELNKLLKLAETFEKLAQEMKVSSGWLSKISGILDTMHKALYAKTEAEMLQYVNPEKFKRTTHTVFEAAEGTIRGRSYMSIYHNLSFSILSRHYDSLLDIYKSLVDGVKPGPKEMESFRFNVAISGGLDFLKDTSIKQTLQYLYMMLIKPAVAAPDPETPAPPKTWGV